MRIVLPTITTTWDSDWREKIKEINCLRLEEAAIFPTCLEKKEREEMYRLLEESTLKRIPLVHLRGDMAPEEISYLKEKFQTEIFNIHSPKINFFSKKLESLKKEFYLENTRIPWDEEEVKEFAGLCLDISHLENDKRLHPEIFENDMKILKKYPIGCNHISAVKKKMFFSNNEWQYDCHKLESFSELDYLKNYDISLFASYIAIELENPIEEQLRAKEYILEILKEKERSK
ncbi:hypothetical protein DRQ29_07305 [bacterium]|nr:MAG: hypothetical protein DRQ29_07305 [bacterium]